MQESERASGERQLTALNIAANRAARKWTSRELALRVLWDISSPLFRYSPRIFWSWRVVLLRLFGARVGAGVHIWPSVRITLPWNLEIGTDTSIGDSVIIYNLGLISIGPSATVSQGAHLCAGTHDYHCADLPLLKPPIAIGEGCWICADAFIGPGISIGAYAIVGARAVAVNDVEPWSIVAGNPARQIGLRAIPRSE